MRHTNRLGVFFIFWKFLFLGHIWGIFGLKFGLKPLGCTIEGVDGLFFPFLCFVIAWGNASGMFFHLLKKNFCRSYLWHIRPKIGSKTFGPHWRRRGWFHFLFVFSYSLGKCSGVGFFCDIFLIFLIFGLKFSRYIF